MRYMRTEWLMVELTACQPVSNATTANPTADNFGQQNAFKGMIGVVVCSTIFYFLYLLLRQ